MTDHAVGSRVARHTVLAFAGFAVPLVIAFAAIPIAARGLGPARFGLLGLGWVFIEYLAVFDLGLARTSVKFVADSLARAPRELRQIVSVAVATQALAGVVAAGIALLLAPALAERIFSVAPDIRAEARAMFLMVAPNVAILIAMSGLRGVLEGAQRFDLSTATKIPSAVASVLFPAIGALAGATLAEILFAVLLVRVAICGILVAQVRRALPGFRWEPPREWRRLRDLFRYSGWVTVTSVATPFLVSFDRFALGAIVGVAAVGFYTAPYEGVTRLLLIPVSMFAALFPTLTSMEVRGKREQTARLMESALRQLAMVLIPGVLLILLFAPQLLELWLGPTFAAEAATALRILVVGVLVNALAHVPSVFLYAADRPDLPAKLHVVEVIFHVPATIVLVTAWGITGAAAAWTIRVTVDAVVLAFFARGAGLRAVGRTVGSRWKAAAAAAATLTVPLVVARAVLRAAPEVVPFIAFGGFTIFTLLAWRQVLTGTERESWKSAVRRRAQSPQTEPGVETVGSRPAT